MVDPVARACVSISASELDRDARARVDLLQRSSCRANTGAKQRQPVDLRDDQVRGDEGNPTADGLVEESIGFDVILVAPAPQRDPGAAIDEQPSGTNGDVPGRRVFSR